MHIQFALIKKASHVYTTRLLISLTKKTLMGGRLISRTALLTQGRTQ